MEQYALYLALKNILLSLSDEFKYSFNDMDSNGKNVAGIYIKGAEPSEYRSISDGSYYNYISRVQLLYQGDNNNNSLMSMLILVSKVRNALIRASNRIYTTSPQISYMGNSIVFRNKNEPFREEEEEVKVILTKVDLLGEVDFKGKTGQGLPKYSLNFKINYSLIEGGDNNG